MKLKSLIISLAFLAAVSLSGSEYYDGVIAVVNGIPIVHSDVMKKFYMIKKNKKITPQKENFELSRILDKYIDDALVYEISQQESIIVSDERVFTQLERVIKEFITSKVKTKDEFEPALKKFTASLLKWKNGEKIDEKNELLVKEFIKKIEDKEKLDFDIVFEELRVQIRRELVMSIAIGVTPPSKEEVKKWYQQNKGKVGFEVWVKHILIRPKGANLTDEQNANKKISEIKQRALGGESFEALAQKYSEDPGSAPLGGDIGWTELHTLDPYFANTVFRMNVPGQISPVFKSSFGYHIVKFLGKRPTSMEKIERMIMYKLYNENMTDQFRKWIVRKRKTSDIKIFLKNYTKEG